MKFAHVRPCVCKNGVGFSPAKYGASVTLGCFKAHTLAMKTHKTSETQLSCASFIYCENKRNLIVFHETNKTKDGHFSDMSSNV